MNISDDGKGDEKWLFRQFLLSFLCRFNNLWLTNIYLDK
jgi:hypothetical protein